MKRRIPPTTPEPKADIRAQVRALLDPRHPKDAVFVARGNEAALPGSLPGVHGTARPEGTLLTTKPGKARAFAKGVSDDGMAKLLGYPEPKSRAMGQGEAVIQAKDGRGAVVTEALVSPRGASRAAKALAKHVPAGGRLEKTTPQAAQLRRAMIRRGES